mmetsp:Transcript_30661/g.34876  ORF Transcript_30661/g.34876 Transcript_30661/m.34876 type:complete len:164 (-) Transcript_30661:522-1013(-)
MLLVSSLLPAGFYVCVVLSWMVYRWVMMTKRGGCGVRMGNMITVSMVAVLLLLHPILVKRAFAMFNCHDLGRGKSYLRADYSIECWTKEHRTWTFGVALTSLLLWGLGIPTIGLAVVIKNRRNLQETETKIKYGFIYQGYRDSHFFWEVVIIYRKVILAALAV